MTRPTAEEHEVHEAVGTDDREQRQALRQSLRARRAALASDEVRAASAAVCAALAPLPALMRARSVALYAAAHGEIDLDALRFVVHSHNIRVAYPRVVSTRPPRLTFHEVGPTETLAAGTFAIPAPPQNAPLVDDLDVILVPAIAFSRDGHRLGFGFGHFDGALAQFPRALRIGVAHDFQLVAPFPTHAADEPVDLIQTPRERIVTGARALAPAEVLS